jgi:protein-disulfide isomerase
MAGFLALRTRIILAAAAATLLSALSAHAGTFSDSQTGEIESIVKSYILKHPEVIQQAIEELSDREKVAEAAARSKSLSDLQGALYSSPNEAIVGNPEGKITLVEFFDYNCGYCKKMLPDIAHLMKANPDLKIILRDFPVLSDASVDAATVAAGVRDQFKGEKFWEFHQRLLAMHGLVGKEQAEALAQDMGANMRQLAHDSGAPQTKAGIEESFKMGRLLQIQGTPSYIVGDAVVDGAVGYDDLQGKVDNVRKCGKTVCS